MLPCSNTCVGHMTTSTLRIAEVPEQAAMYNLLQSSADSMIFDKI